MHIFPFQLPKAASVAPQGANMLDVSGVAGSVGDDSFANLLGGAVENSVNSLQVGANAAEGSQDVSPAGLAALQKALKKMGLDAKDTEALVAHLQILPQARQDELLRVANAAEGGKDIAMRAMSMQDKQHLTSLLQKLGFQGKEPQRMLAQVEAGRGRDVWNAVESRLRSMSPGEQTAVGKSELLALRHALNLDAQAQARVGQTLAGAGQSRMSAKDMENMLQLMEAESVRSDKELQEKVDNLRQTLQAALDKAKERQRIESNADARQDKATEQARLKIEHAVKERGDAEEAKVKVGLESKNAKADGREPPAQAGAVKDSRSQEGRRLPEIKAEEQAAGQAAKQSDALDVQRERAAAAARIRAAMNAQTQEQADEETAAANTRRMRTEKTDTEAGLKAEAFKATIDKAQNSAGANNKTVNSSNIMEAAVHKMESAQQAAADKTAVETPARLQTEQVAQAKAEVVAGVDDARTDQPKGLGRERLEIVEAGDAHKHAETSSREKDSRVDAPSSKDFFNNRGQSDRDGSANSNGGNRDGGQDFRAGVDSRTVEAGQKAESNMFASTMSRADQAAEAAKSSTQTSETRPHVTSDQVLKQIEEGTLRNLGQGRRRLTLRLDPPTLGKVHVMLQVADKEVRAVLRADNAEAGRMIAENMHQLRASLEAQGLRVDRLEVQTQAQNSGPDMRDGQRQDAQEHNQAREQRDAQQQTSLRRNLASVNEAEDEEMARHVQEGDMRENVSTQRLNLIA